MNHFFDVGANIGQTFDDFLCPTKDFDGWTIWCFEPSPRHLPGLIERVSKERNRFSIKICPFGLWAATAIVRLFEKNDEQGDSFEEVLNNTSNLENGYEIHAAVFPLVGFISNVIGENDHATIKLDAEGAEYAIL